MSGIANAFRRHPELMVAAVLVLTVVTIGLVNPVFWQPANLFSLLRASVITGILGLAVLLVMLSGGIDVSFPAFAIAARERIRRGRARLEGLKNGAGAR